jgi:hypothetical protein
MVGLTAMACLVAIRPACAQTEIDPLALINDARAALVQEKVDVIEGVVGTRRVRVGRRKYRMVPINGVVGREMAIAIGDADGRILIARAIKRDRGLECLTPGVILSVRRDNGINSDIACIKPAGGRILAVKYPVMNERQRFGPGPSVLGAVYTPYSAEISTEEVVTRGVEFQHDLIDRAYTRLARTRVQSRAFEGREVVDVIPPDLVNALLLNEHIDPSEFTGAGMARRLVERVLTIVATNRDKAYAYSISHAGARGLVQMIPSTYRMVLAAYPSAGLMSEFGRGMSDPINAIMAQILLCDLDWQTIRRVADIPASRIGPYLAAAYNGGVGRVVRVIANEGTDWMERPEGNQKPTVTIARKVPVRVRTARGRMRTTYVVKRYTAPILRAETDKYVRQYHWIKAFLVANKLDAPKRFARPR